MSALKFYTNPMSRGQIVRWALEEVGAQYDPVIVSYGPEMQSEAYRAINPMAKVPTIVHDGQVVTECAAICTYLADAFPEAGLAPTAEERAQYLRWLFFAAGPLEQAVTNKSMGWDPEGERQGMSGYGTYERTMDALEGWLRSHDFVTGKRFTMADVYVGSQVSWGVQFGTMPKRDAFMSYAERATDRPAYRRAKQVDVDLIAAAQKG